MRRLFVLAGLAAALPCLWAQSCATRDFGISSEGTLVFSVLSSNRTCSCLNYQSEGLASFNTVAANSVSAADLSASVLTINGTSFFDGAALFNAPATFEDLRLSFGSVLDLGYNAVDRDPDAGKLSYAAFEPDALTVVGAGTASGGRTVRVLDELRVGELASLSGSYRCGGLDGSYFQNKQVAEPAVCRQVDAALFFAWPGSGPCNVCGGQLGCTGWSARWTGHILAPITGALTLSLTSDDGVRLWWGGSDPSPLIDGWSDHNATLYTASVTVVSGQYYPIRIEYYQANDGFQLILNWNYTGQPITSIPSSALCTAPAVRIDGGSSEFGGDVTFRGPAFFPAGIGSTAAATSVAGGLTAAGAVSFGGAIASASGGPLRVPSPVALTGSGLLSVAGSATFSDTVTFGTAGVDASGDLLLVSSNLTVAQSLEVGGPASFVGKVTASQRATFKAGLSIPHGQALGVTGFDYAWRENTYLKATEINATSSVLQLFVPGSYGGNGGASTPRLTITSEGEVGVGVNATRPAAMLHVSGSGQFRSALNLSDVVYFDGGMACSPVALSLLRSNLSVAGSSSLTVGGPATLTGAATFGGGIRAASGALQVASPVTLTGSNPLTVGGNATIAGLVTLNGNVVNSNGPLGVDASVALPGARPLTVGGATAVAGALAVGGAATFNAGIELAHGQFVSTATDWRQNGVLAAAWDSSGSRDLLHLYVPGAYGGNGTANPTPRLSIGSNGTVGIGTANPVTTLDVQGPAAVNGPLTVQGLATLGGTVTVAGGNNTLLVSAALAVGGTLKVGGTTRHSGEALYSQGTLATTRVCGVGDGTTGENGDVTVTCPAGQRVVQIDYASYGRPTGTCGAYVNGACASSSSHTVVMQACLFQTTCTVRSNNTFFGDPCNGSAKWLMIQAQCGPTAIPAEVLHYQSDNKSYRVQRWTGGARIIYNPPANGGMLVVPMGVLWDPVGMGVGAGHPDNVPFRFTAVLHCYQRNTGLAWVEAIGTKRYGFGVDTYNIVQQYIGSGFTAGATTVSITAGPPSSLGTTLSFSSVATCPSPGGYQLGLSVESFIF